MLSEWVLEIANEDPQMPSKEMNTFASEDLVRLTRNTGMISQNRQLGRVSLLEGSVGIQWQGQRRWLYLWILNKAKQNKPWKYLEEGTKVYIGWGSLQGCYEDEATRDEILGRCWRSYWRDRKNVRGILMEEAGYKHLKKKVKGFLSWLFI